MSASILSARNFSAHGVAHGFTTRLGGISRGAFSSFNLSGRVGDDPQAVAENRRRFARRTGLRLDALVDLTQVHGDEVLVIDRPADQLPPVERRRGDASLTVRDDVVLAVRTADCVPILLYCPRPRAVAAVHAGWRGSLCGVAARAVARLAQATGCSRSELLAAIGPCIHAESYAVGPEVFAPFRERFGEPVTRTRGDRQTVDLALANRRWLAEAGVPAARIEAIDLCTFDRADLFYSHRRDRGRTGRQMAYISLAGSCAQEANRAGI